MRYVLDANTYIQAKNQYYGMDFCPAYWDWLDHQFHAGLLTSVQMVGQELRSGNDELAEWAKARADQFVAHDDEATQNVFADIAQFVAEGDYQAASRDNFLAKADPWLIAKAKVLGATVVSHEATVQPQSRKVKVPNICLQFEVPCISTFDLLRQLQARFGLTA